MGQQPGGTPNTCRTVPPKAQRQPPGSIFMIGRSFPAIIAGMRVLFERSGGFAGIRLQLSLDVDSLPAEDASRLKSLLARSRFFELPEKLTSAGIHPDRFTYRVTVESDQGVQSVEAPESAVPREMRPLLEWLTQNSRRS